MILGLNRGEIKLVEPQEGWKEEFLKTQKEIHEATSIDINRIEHIGSTSIKGIKAKPMIDFAVGVDDVNNVPSHIFRSLQEISFYRLRVVLEDEIVLAKFDNNETFDVKTHIIHMVDYRGEKWNDLILFRDKLNSSQALRKEYEELKANYIQNETGDMDDYTNYKERFILGVLKD
ncbi:GrpB family protein [Sporosarcina sp. Marseille-Q4063]|uniref:GrpB family protein n=1 Tax=Sporosarcina sp. Marseille-Q4063 TaxID=2810514 RepID=UPI001BB0CE55|nr:GrpB family protein [Sporosarcina sp. Marseille-Q4063]QUW20530.1 GrpB family protein [Sporosarcina sp. Marseille-Q4063]